MVWIHYSLLSFVNYIDYFQTVSDVVCLVLLGLERQCPSNGDCRPEAHACEEKKLWNKLRTQQDAHEYLKLLSSLEGIHSRQDAILTAQSPILSVVFTFLSILSSSASQGTCRLLHINTFPWLLLPHQGTREAILSCCSCKQPVFTSWKSPKGQENPTISPFFG